MKHNRIIHSCIALFALLLCTGQGQAQHISIGSGAHVKLQPGAVVVVPGNFKNSGNYNADNASYSVFAGAGAQTLTGATSFGRLLRNGGGTLTLNSNITVADMLKLNSGTIVLGAQHLTLGPLASIAGTPSASAMVITDGTGEFRKEFTGSGSFTFPVGDNTGTSEYAPVTLDFTSGAFASAHAAVRTVNLKHPDNNGADDYLNRYWIVTQSGITGFSCNTTFRYNTADVTGSASDMWLASWNGSYWDLYNPANTGTQELTGTVSSFTDFTGAPAPEINVPVSMAYGKIELGSYFEQNIVVENTGGIDLAVTSTSITGINAGEYTITSGGAPFHLSPGGTRTVVVRFTPDTATTILKTASLELESNDPVTGTATVSLSGYGIPSLEHIYTLLADNNIGVSSQSFSDGELHANSVMNFARGGPSTHTGNLTAVTRIKIMMDNTIVGKVQANQLLINGGATITGTRTSSAAPSVTMPGCSVTHGVANYTVAQNGSGSIAPDSWNTVTVGKGGTLTVSSGTYSIKKLVLKKGAKLYVNMTHGPVILGISTNMTFGVDAEVNFSAWGDEASRWVTFNTAQTTDVLIGANARVLGSIHAPYADVDLDAGVSFKGSVRSDNIEVSAGAVFIHHTSSAALPKEMAPKQPLADGYILDQNFPNPFNPTTTITYTVPEESSVVLRVFDAFGREVRTLIDRAHPEGSYVVEFNARDLPSGTYLYTLETDRVMLKRRMVLLK
jgi:Secretion system C-terminal sorting domain